MVPDRRRDRRAVPPRPAPLGLPLLASGLGIVLASFLLFGINIIPVKLAAINLLEAAVCALLLRRTLPANDPLSDLGCWLRFVVCAVIFTPLFSALLAAGLSPTPDQTFWQSFGIWFISEAIGCCRWRRLASPITAAPWRR